MVVPVPRHPARRHECGYDQANVMVRARAKRLAIALEPNLLVGEKPRALKLVRPHGSVRVDKLYIHLVDDVLTTGATPDGCGRALKPVATAFVMGLIHRRVVPYWPRAGSQRKGQDRCGKRNQLRGIRISMWERKCRVTQGRAVWIVGSNLAYAPGPISGCAGVCRRLSLRSCNQLQPAASPSCRRRCWS